MRSSLGNFALLGYAGVAYASFVITAVWAVGFLADRGVPATVDGGAGPTAWIALLADGGLLLVFAVQHTVMARAGFKRRLARLVPAAAERSTYVLATGLALALMFWQWQPLPESVWRVSAQPWTALIWLVYALGWLIAVAATFMVDHLDFLGLRQARWAGGRRPGQGQYQLPVFREHWLYAWVRHPMMLGLLIAFWATPAMTAGHLFFAAGGTAYIAVGLRFEERDLLRQHGSTYQDYARRVPAIMPGVAGRKRPVVSG